MPCNDPTVNTFTEIGTKTPITDHNALAAVIYGLRSDGTITYFKETEDGYVISTVEGDVTISYRDGEYKIMGSGRAINSLKTKLLTGYSAIIVRDALIDRGYMTEVTEIQNTVQIKARRL